MRIHALMVTKDEAGRYLDLVLEALRPAVHGLFVYDDQSMDATVAIARSHASYVAVRPNHVPAFLEHEGRFRQAAWDAFCEMVVPEVGDWILAIDADELVVALGDPADVLQQGAREATRRGDLARLIRIPEVFDVRNGAPYVRLDGFWGRIQGTRFFAYKPGGVFADRPMASGSEPLYVNAGVGQILEGFWLLHLGYARKEDRVEKYRRYSERSGHGDTHVASILRDPDLARWNGPSIPRLTHHFARFG